MLRWISKSGTFFQFAIYTILLALLWIPAFVNPKPPIVAPGDGPLYTLLLSWTNVSLLLNVAITLLLIVIQSVTLFYICQSNGFIKRSNFLPAIISLLGFSWNTDFLTLHAVLPAALFIILALNSLMTMYGQQNAYNKVFLAAFFIGIASLFYMPIAYMLILIWLSLITYRVLSWREYVIALIGFLLPFVYYFSWLYWNDTFIAGLMQLADSIFLFVLPVRLSMINTVWLSVSAFIMVVNMLAGLSVVSDKLISLRRKTRVLINVSITAFIIVVLAGWPFLSANYLFVIPMAFFLTASLTLIKKPFWFELIALGYFLLFIVMRVYVIL